MEKLWLLGSGTPTPTPERFGTSYVLQINKEIIMIDCGPAATHKLVKTGILPTQIDYLFFTHHHFDHNADYPCFLLCRWDQSTGKENRLNVWGPKPTTLITERLIGKNGAFSFDVLARINHPASQRVHVNRGGTLPRPEPKVSVFDIRPGEVINGDKWKAVSAQTQHVQPWLESLAYRVETDNGIIVFLGDTEPCESIGKLADGADVLIVNCWDRQKGMEETGETSAMIGTTDAAIIARDSNAKLLILTHTGPNMCQPKAQEKTINDITSIYSGKVIFGKELMSIDLK